MTFIPIPITQHGATSLISHGKLKLQEYQSYPQFNDQSYSPEYQSASQQQYQDEPSLLSDSDFKDKMLNLLSKMEETNQILKS